MPKQSKLLVLLFVIAFITRLVFFFLVQPYKPSVESGLILVNDASGYHLLAKTLVESHEFAYQEGGAPDCLRTPGYPLFISSFYFLFGVKPWVPILFQSLLDSLSCVILYTIIFKFSTARIALSSSLIYAVDPFLMFYSVTLLSETLFIFLLVVATLYFTKAGELNFNKSSKAAMSIAGLCFGLATLVRPISLYLIIIIPVICFILLRHDMKLFVTSALVFVLVFSLSISPWLFRNMISYSTVALSTSGDINALLLFVVPMEAERRGMSTHDVKTELVREVESIIQHSGIPAQMLNDFQRSKYYKELAIRYIINNPKSFLKQYYLGIVRSFTSVGSEGFARALNLSMVAFDYSTPKSNNVWSRLNRFIHRPFYDIALYLYVFLQYFCLLIGLIVSLKYPDKKYIYFCLIMSAYFIFLAGPSGYSRFRLPAFPFYLIFIGIGLDYFFSKVWRVNQEPKLMD